MRVLVCGSRDFTDPLAVSLAIGARIGELPPGCEILHGGARGADLIAAEAAVRRGHHVRVFPANWDTEGKRAGALRNLRMLDEKPDLVLAFWDGKSPGTKHTITEAHKRGIPTEVIEAA